MKSYLITVTERIEYTYRVKANSEEETIKKAELGGIEPISREAKSDDKTAEIWREEKEMKSRRKTPKNKA